MVASGVMDACRPHFMLPGHTKFGLDLVERSVGGKYNKSDVFNQCMMLKCMTDYSVAQVYDATVLFHWKKAINCMFDPVNNNTIYCYFFIVADDGDFNPGTPVSMPSDLEPFPGSPAPLYEDKALRSAASAVAKISLCKIVRESITEKRVTGVGSGYHPGGGDLLMPYSVLTSRKVRLFMRQRPSEPVWREQVN